MTARPPMAGTMKALGELALAAVQPRAYQFLSVEELRALLASSEAPTVVDCRAESDFAAGHIAGAVNVPYRSFMKSHEAVPRGAAVVAVCYVGMYSRAAAQKLARSGHGKVFSLLGGMEAWMSSAGPVER